MHAYIYTYIYTYIYIYIAGEVGGEREKWQADKGRTRCVCVCVCVRRMGRQTRSEHASSPASLLTTPYFSPPNTLLLCSQASVFACKTWPSMLWWMHACARQHVC